MRRTPRSAPVAMAIAIAAGSALTGGLGAGVASAEATVVPFGQILRRCDFSAVKNVGATGYGRPTGQIRSDGGEVVADIQFATGAPNTRYDVRLIQAPRSSAQTCVAGDPGVAAGALVTDAAGAGSVTVRGPIMSGATGAWVYITLPNAYSQVPADFYSTDMLAAL